MNPIDVAKLPLENLRYKIPPLPGPGYSSLKVNKDSKLYKECLDFQAVFIKQMLDSMRKTVDHSDDLIKRSQGQDIFEDMLYDQYAKNMSKEAGFDLAKQMYQQFSFLQGLPKQQA